jgi:hypothetical protein
MGFTLTAENEREREFELALEKFEPLPTRIKITRRALKHFTARRTPASIKEV